MKVVELEGILLDTWVARAEGDLVRPYSTEWALAGPIIDREYIGAFPAAEFGWAAFIQGPNCRYVDTYAYDEMCGPTLLIAAMRAYVASKFGDEVPDQVA